MKQNKKIEPIAKKTILNYEEGIAFSMSPEMELYTRVATSLMGESKFYDPQAKDTTQAIVSLVEQISKTNPEFIFQLASYARNELYLRTIPLVLLVEASRYKETKPYVKAYAPSIVKRADELAEVLAYYIKRNGDIGDHMPDTMLSHPLQKGLQRAFHNFNEYQFAKYNRDNEVKLRDALRIIRPRPRNDEESKLFLRIKDGTLKTPDTWEVVISTKGSTKENWEAILPKMPFMARLRNIRNFLEKGVDITTIIEMLRNPEAIHKSKQFPYRFFSAYREVSEVNNLQTPKVMEALQIAMELSIENIPTWKGITAIISDNSGSMSTVGPSERSKIMNIEIAGILSAMAYKLCPEGAYVGVFGHTYKFIRLDPRNGILTNSIKVHAEDVGHSTNAWLPIRAMTTEAIYVDRIVLFSDMQCYDSHNPDSDSFSSAIESYRKLINPNVYVYSFDLAGYGTAQVVENSKNTAILAGWSDKVLSLVPAFENKKSILENIHQINHSTYVKQYASDE